MTTLPDACALPSRDVTRRYQTRAHSFTTQCNPTRSTPATSSHADLTHQDVDGTVLECDEEGRLQGPCLAKWLRRCHDNKSTASQSPRRLCDPGGTRESQIRKTTQCTSSTTLLFLAGLETHERSCTYTCENQQALQEMKSTLSRSLSPSSMKTNHNSNA